MKRLLSTLLALLSVLILSGCEWGEVLPTVEEVLPKVDEVLPTVEEVLPKVDEVLPVIEEALSNEQGEAGETEQAETGTAEQPAEEPGSPSDAVPAEELFTSNTASPEPDAAPEPSASNTAPPEPDAAPDLSTSNAAGTALSEDDTYDSRDDVALYLVTYHHLPDNYITKSEARALGWNGGGLEKYAPGKCIGGDTFGNREGLLPKGHTYTECDIDTMGASSRGAKRIVYSEDFSIYYTGSHYESFDLLYEGGTQP